MSLCPGFVYATSLTVLCQTSQLLAIGSKSPPERFIFRSCVRGSSSINPVCNMNPYQAPNSWRSLSLPSSYTRTVKLHDGNHFNTWKLCFLKKVFFNKFDLKSWSNHSLLVIITAIALYTFNSYGLPSFYLLFLQRTLNFDLICFSSALSISTSMYCSESRTKSGFLTL